MNIKVINIGGVEFSVTYYMNLMKQPLIFAITLPGLEPLNFLTMFDDDTKINFQSALEQALNDE